MNIVLIQPSLNKDSKTSVVLNHAKQSYEERGDSVTLYDLREVEIPQCRAVGLEDYNNSTLLEIQKKLIKADAVVFWMPVYQYSFSWVLKNFIDLFWRDLLYKKACFVTVSWWVRSYMAVWDLIKVLYFECGMQCVAPFVHAWAWDFEDWEVTNPKVFEKIATMVENT